jgi:hypothetical protein
MMKTESGKPANVANLCRRQPFIRALDRRRKCETNAAFISRYYSSLIRGAIVNIV